MNCRNGSISASPNEKLQGGHRQLPRGSLVQINSSLLSCLDLHAVNVRPALLQREAPSSATRNLSFTEDANQEPYK